MFSNLWKISILIFFHFSLLLYALIVVIFLPFCHALEDLGINFLLMNQTCARPSSVFVISIIAFSRFHQINSKVLIIYFFNRLVPDSSSLVLKFAAFVFFLHCLQSNDPQCFLPCKSFSISGITATNCPPVLVSLCLIDYIVFKTFLIQFR